jgi:hypothetical protein
VQVKETVDGDETSAMIKIKVLKAKRQRKEHVGRQKAGQARRVP